MCMHVNATTPTKFIVHLTTGHVKYEKVLIFTELILIGMNMFKRKTDK